MGSQRTRGTHSKAHRQSTCLADAMAGRRTPSVCRSPPREAAPGSSAAGRAGALPRGLPLSLSPRPAGGPQRGRPGPPAAAALFGAEDRSPPPPGCAAPRCTGLGSSRLAAARRRLGQEHHPAARGGTAPGRDALLAAVSQPWPNAGVLTELACNQHRYKDSPNSSSLFVAGIALGCSFQVTFTGKRVLLVGHAAYECSAKQPELFQLFSAIPPSFQQRVHLFFFLW